MKSEVRDFFRGKSVLVTGATGFLGKALVEKILRSCPGVAAIYLLVRPKQDFNNVQARWEQILENPNKTDNPDVLTKMHPIAGDIGLEQLGMSASDWNLLTSQVSVVIHSAATIKFNEMLSTALELNVNGLRRIIYLCRQMKQLKALVHVSTAYSNCDLANIEEKVYPPPRGSNQIIKCLDNLSELQLSDPAFDDIVNSCRPNTYTYTKALGEHFLTIEAADLPVCILRPSIVTGSWKEPIAGWVDNVSGPTGLITGIGLGALRVLMADSSKLMNAIPVDLVANLIICAAWDTGSRTKSDNGSITI